MSARVRAGQLALMLATIVISLLLVEGGLRILGLFPPATSYAAFIEHDPERGWRNVPGASGHYTTDEFHVALEYNGRAYRGPLYPYDKAPGTFRVLMLGDSFVEGFTVAREARVSEQLAALMSAGGRPTEVVPLGTGGYGTDQQLLWLGSEGLRYSPDVVVVMFYYNDVWYNTATDYNLGGKPRFVPDGDSLRLTNVPVPPPPPPSVRSVSARRRIATWFREHTRLGALGSRAVKSSGALRRVAVAAGVAEEEAVTALGDPGSDAVLDEFRVFLRDSQPDIEESWRVTERLLREIRDRTRAAGAELVLFHIPFRFSLDLGGDAPVAGDPRANEALDLSRVAARFTGICGRLAVRCIEPSSVYQEQARRSAEPLYFQYDWHWTAAGNALAARILADSLDAPARPAMVSDAIRP